MSRSLLACGALALLVSLAACSTTDDPSSSADPSTSSTLATSDGEPADDTVAPTTPAAPTTAAPTTAAPTTTATPGTAASTTPAAPGDGAVDPLILERPVDVIVPDGLDPATPAALVVVLHGYTGTGMGQEIYFGFRSEAADRQVLLVHPNGTADRRGSLFWDASDACCNFSGATVDDVEYLAAVVAHVDTLHPVDPDRVFLAGHSNGGFMSFRLACERADLFAAVVSLAGAMDADTSGCDPGRPVSVAQVHGTDDATIGIDGGDLFGRPYTSAEGTVHAWATANGCSGTLDDGASTGVGLDLDVSIDGAETTARRAPGCPADGAVELWTIEGGSHIPKLGPGFAEAVFDFFEANPRP